MSCQDYHIFFFNDTATTEIYTLSLHDALPIYCYRLPLPGDPVARDPTHARLVRRFDGDPPRDHPRFWFRNRSEEHTSELQSRQYLVCRLLLEKKKSNKDISLTHHIKSSTISIT